MSIGPSLRTHLAIKGALDLPTVLRIGHQIASGLAASHKQGITHRDIKPGNIVLDLATGQAKLTDFGWLRIEGDPRLTINGFVAGTPAYMSPEQATGGKGRPSIRFVQPGQRLVHDGDWPISIRRRAGLWKHWTVYCTTEPLAPQSINPGISPALVHLIQRLHAKRRDDRPATAEEVAEILHQQLLELLHPNPSIVRAEHGLAIQR
jgi:serine/threonine protein kinase